MDKSLNYKTLLKQLFSFSVGTWLNALISFFTVPIVTHLIIPEEFGKAMMFSTFYSMVVIFIVAGNNNSFARFFYEVKEKDRTRLLWSSLIIPLTLISLFSAFSLFLFKPIAYTISKTPSRKVVLLLDLALFSGILQFFNMLVIRMRKKGLLYSTLQVIQSISNTAGVILFALIFERSFYSIIFGQIFSNILTFAIGIFVTRDYWFPIEIDKKLIILCSKYGLPFILTSSLYWLLTWTDRLTLRAFSNFSEIGLYSAAFKVVAIINIIRTGFETFWLPVAFETYEKDKNNTKFFRKAFLVASLVMFIIGIIVITAKDVIFLLLAPSYRKAANIGPFLVLVPIMGALSSITMRGIDFTKKTYWHTISSAIAAIVNIVGNLFLVPLWGARGAALSTGFSFILLFVIRTVASEKLYFIGYPKKKTYFSIIILVSICTTATFVDNAAINLLINAVGLLLIVLIYKDVFKKLVKNSIELASKIRFHLNKK